MLNQEDLQKIGVEVGKVIEQNIMPALDQMLTKEDGEKFATKEDLDRFATKEDLGRLEGRFDRLEERIISKFAEVQNELAGIRLELEKLSKRVKEDTDALASDVVKMRQKLNVLEKEVNMLKLQLEKA